MKNPKRLSDDPRFTAYALGELPTEERAAFEAELAADPEAQAELAELRALTGRLEDELTTETGTSPELSREQRASLVAALNGKTPSKRSWRRVAANVVGIAATFAGCLWVWHFTHPEKPQAPWTYSIFSDTPELAQVNPAQGAGRITRDPKEESDPLMTMGYVRQDSTQAELSGLGYLTGVENQTSEDFSLPSFGLTPETRTEFAGADPTLRLNAMELSVGQDGQATTPQLRAFVATADPKAGGELSLYARAADEPEWTLQDSLGRELSSQSMVNQVLAVDQRILTLKADQVGKRPVHSRWKQNEEQIRDLEALRDQLTQVQPSNTEAYQGLVENSFLRVPDSPLSTFSIDVDTASYANMRRFLRDGQLPPADAIRIEELINYFDYEYPPATGNQPFSVHAEVAACPWAPAHQLVKIGLAGRAPEHAARAQVAKNLVFLIDVSGSMQARDKLELLKKGLRLLVPGLGDEDTVAIAVYAGASGLCLPATSDKAKILAALDGLQAGGSTNGAAGIELAYRTAQENFRPEGTNRVILCTDGDFNVGTTSDGELQRLIEEKRETGVFLSVLGFGTGNLKDSKMETIANHGNGVYYYIDSIREAEKVLVRDLHATLETIAKDVKIQVEFNPAEVSAYRLIGYENRALAAQDFNDDTKDAGEIGAGHTVTAFYEVVPVGVASPAMAGIDELKYQPAAKTESLGVANGELMTVKLRYKEPTADTSQKLELPVRATERAWTQTSEDFRFAAGVALFGMCLRGSAHTNGATLGTAFELSSEGAGPDPWGYRAEFLSLVQRAMEL